MIKTTPSNITESELLEDFFEESESAISPISLQLTEEVCGERLDKVLSKLIPQFSRSRLQQWITSGHVLVDGIAGRNKMTVLGDEAVMIYPQAAPEDNAYLPEQIALPIVFEDESIIVINKPAGLVVHPAAGNWSGTLLNGLLHYLPALSFVPRAGIVHRLDKDTSGLMVIAKTLEAQTALVRQLQAKTVQREYLALVWGKPNLCGTINAAMARHPRDRLKMAVSESLSAKPAVTHFRRVAMGELDGKSVALVECRLETGRTHQIRVHLAHLGFPLVGDAVYGKPHLVKYFPRQALQARRLGLLHPATHHECTWEVELADDMTELFTHAEIHDVEFTKT